MPEPLPPIPFLVEEPLPSSAQPANDELPVSPIAPVQPLPPTTPPLTLSRRFPSRPLVAAASVIGAAVIGAGGGWVLATQYSPANLPIGTATSDQLVAFAEHFTAQPGQSSTTEFRFFRDTNANGIRDTGEQPVTDINVSLSKDGATFGSVTKTDEQGTVRFSQLSPNTQVQLEHNPPFPEVYEAFKRDLLTAQVDGQSIPMSIGQRGWHPLPEKLVGTATDIPVQQYIPNQVMAFGQGATTVFFDPELQVQVGFIHTRPSQGESYNRVDANSTGLLFLNEKDELIHYNWYTHQLSTLHQNLTGARRGIIDFWLSSPSGNTVLIAPDQAGPSRIQVVSKTSCGNGFLQYDNQDLYLDTSSNPDTPFQARLQGDQIFAVFAGTDRNDTKDDFLYTFSCNGSQWTAKRHPYRGYGLTWLDVDTLLLDTAIQVADNGAETVIETNLVLNTRTGQQRETGDNSLFPSLPQSGVNDIVAGDSKALRLWRATDVVAGRFTALTTTPSDLKISADSVSRAKVFVGGQGNGFYLANTGTDTCMGEGSDNCGEILLIQPSGSGLTVNKRWQLGNQPVSTLEGVWPRP